MLGERQVAYKIRRHLSASKKLSPTYATTDLVDLTRLGDTPEQASMSKPSWGRAADNLDVGTRVGGDTLKEYSTSAC